MFNRFYNNGKFAEKCLCQVKYLSIMKRIKTGTGIDRIWYCVRDTRLK